MAPYYMPSKTSDYYAYTTASSTSGFYGEYSTWKRATKVSPKEQKQLDAAAKARKVLRGIPERYNYVKVFQRRSFR
jgi:hypothetical protein